MVQTFVEARAQLVPGARRHTEAVAMATCPGCHTTHATLTMADLTAGAYWNCEICAASWDGRRLATAAAYATWNAERDRRIGGVAVNKGGEA